MVVNNFLATILELVRQCPTLSDRVGGVMNLLLLTQEEAALAGRPEAKVQCPMTNVQGRTQSGLDRVSPHPGGEEEFLRLLFEFTHSVQLNPDRTIALAAKRWERALRFRLAVTRQRRWQRHLPCSPAPVGIRSQESGRVKRGAPRDLGRGGQ